MIKKKTSIRVGTFCVFYPISSEYLNCFALNTPQSLIKNVKQLFP